MLGRGDSGLEKRVSLRLFDMVAVFELILDASCDEMFKDKGTLDGKEMRSGKRGRRKIPVDESWRRNVERSVTRLLCQHAGPAYKRPKRINGVTILCNAHKPPKEDVEWPFCLEEEGPLVRPTVTSLLT